MICGDCLLVKGDGQQKLAHLARCNSWLCDECIHIRRKRLTAEIISGQPNLWFTLTIVPHAYESPDEAARDLSDAMSKIAANAKTEHGRKIQSYKTPRGLTPINGWKRNDRGEVERQVRLKGDKLHYYAVMEATKAGAPHFHVFARAHFIAADWLQAQMLEHCGSFIVDVERLESHRKAAVYAAKYTGKGPHRFGLCKRYRKSTGWRLVERRRPHHAHSIPGNWERDTLSLRRWMDAFREVGWSVRLVDARTAYAERPP
jgi:hypothetical protein